MLDRRKYRRFSLDFYLQVLDQNTNKKLGSVINISEGGLLVMASNKPLEQDKVYNLWMEAPLSSGITEQFLFEAKVARVVQNPNTGCYECGFEFVTTSSEDFVVALIKHMEDKVAVG